MTIENELVVLALFTIGVIALLLLDLGIHKRREKEITVSEALKWSAFWIALALIFNLGIYLWLGEDSALMFLTGYLIEKSLSVDNLFVFLLIFSYFNVPARYQHNVLFWGILGALVLRGLLIGMGVVLISQFHWILYIFGAFLIFTGVKMGFQKESVKIKPERNILVRLFKKVYPVSPEYHGSKFFIKQGKRRSATLLFIVVLVVETTDLLFAVDSIPAIFAITTDPMIVYTSNIFAILGLRALYFALAGMMNLFHYLKVGLSIVLTFIGVKMLIADFVHLPISVALGVVGGVLALSILASMIWPKEE